MQQISAAHPDLFLQKPMSAVAVGVDTAAIWVAEKTGWLDQICFASCGYQTALFVSYYSRNVRRCASSVQRSPIHHKFIVELTSSFGGYLASSLNIFFSAF